MLLSVCPAKASSLKAGACRLVTRIHPVPRSGVAMQANLAGNCSAMKESGVSCNYQMPNANDIETAAPMIINRRFNVSMQPWPPLKADCFACPTTSAASQIACSDFHHFQLLNHEHDACCIVLPRLLTFIALVLFRFTIGMLVNLYKLLDLVDENGQMMTW
jgi:hypothetical protein